MRAFENDCQFHSTSKSHLTDADIDIKATEDETSLVSEMCELYLGSVVDMFSKISTRLSKLENTMTELEQYTAQNPPSKKEV